MKTQQFLLTADYSINENVILNITFNFPPQIPLKPPHCTFKNDQTEQPDYKYYLGL